jgi:hypothetical protein
LGRWAILYQKPCGPKLGHLFPNFGHLKISTYNWAQRFKQHKKYKTKLCRILKTHNFMLISKQSKSKNIHPKKFDKQYYKWAKSTFEGKKPHFFGRLSLQLFRI